MYRLLEQKGEARERRDQLTHPPYQSRNCWPRLPINSGAGTSPSWAGGAGFWVAK
jgi:hypothetical protein